MSADGNSFYAAQEAVTKRWQTLLAVDTHYSGGITPRCLLSYPITGPLPGQNSADGATDIDPPFKLEPGARPL